MTQAFLALGFIDCGSNEQLETGFEKIALYASASLYTHAARQLPTGKWTSKLGNWVDVEHNSPDDVAGGVYGEVYQILQRPTTL